jgi:putative ABC transport system permease protein
LSSFAYKTYPGPDLFLVAGLLTILLVLVTISFRTIKIANANPTEALRSE